jgi:hypothetical protein
MKDPVTGGPHTAHTTNPVPMIYVAEDAPHYRLRNDGSLRDISPHAAQHSRRWPAQGDDGRRLRVPIAKYEDIQAEDFEGYILQRLDVVENGQREEEKEHRQRGQHGQRYIQAAMEALPGAAVRALGKMMLVVLAHLRRDPGNVIPPACKDSASDSVRASGTCHNVKDSLCKGCAQPRNFCAPTWQVQAFVPQMLNLVLGCRFALFLPRQVNQICLWPPGKSPLPINLVQSDARLLPL